VIAVLMGEGDAGDPSQVEADCFGPALHLADAEPGIDQ
jgi:hypothetical protein